MGVVGRIRCPADAASGSYGALLARHAVERRVGDVGGHAGADDIRLDGVVVHGRVARGTRVLRVEIVRAGSGEHGGIGA